MIARMFCISAGLLLLTAAPAAGQYDQIVPGAHVRVKMERIDDGGWPAPREQLVGRVVASSEDSLTFQTEGEQATTVAYAAIERLDVSTSTHSNAGKAAVAVGVGIGVLATLAALTNDGSSSNESCNDGWFGTDAESGSGRCSNASSGGSSGAVFMVAAVPAAILGMLIGANTRSPRWTRVPLEKRVTVEARASRGSIGLRLRF